MSIRSELEALTKKGNGILKPEAGVAWAAAHKNSALHKALEWRDDVAGHAYRLHQMRQIIRIEFYNINTNLHEMISLSVDRTTPGGGYRSLETVMQSVQMRSLLLKDALEELDRIRLKYSQLDALKKVWDEIDRARAGATV